MLSPDDARRAAGLADGIIVSNHGGRQLDFSPAAVDMLPAVAEAVHGRVPLLVDGAVSRGTGALTDGCTGSACACALLVGLACPCLPRPLSSPDLLQTSSNAWRLGQTRCWWAGRCCGR